MPFDLTAGIACILKPDGSTAGTGFVVSGDGLIITCAHVVETAAAGPRDVISIVFHLAGDEAVATVEPDSWRASDAEDIAFLRVDGSLPDGVRPLVLDLAQDSQGHTFISFGYPQIGQAEEAHIRGMIDGLVKHPKGWKMLQLTSSQVAPGVSGAPVLDTHTGRVVGMISEFPSWKDKEGRIIAGDAYGRHTATNHAVPTELLLEVWPALAKHLIPASRSAIAWLKTGRCDFYQHVDLPTHYIPRPDELSEVRAALLDNPGGLALTSALKMDALHGMGGIGKTVIARTLCDDAQVQAAFPDGILWATLGQTPDLANRLREWIDVLGGTISENAPTIERLKATLTQLLEDRACLLIVDDVWQRTALETFQVGGPRCHLLLTTRDAEIARELNAAIWPVDVMAHDEAVRLLEAWAGEGLRDVDPTLKIQIVERLGRLPLAVKLAGAQLRRKEPVRWLEAFDVRKLESRRLERVHDSLFRTFALSLDALSATARHCYTAMAIFKEDEAIPFVAIARLWLALEGLAEDRANDLLDDLADRALIQVSEESTASGITITLHDMLRDFIAAELGEDGHILAHQALLEVYQGVQTGEGWHTTPDDGYFFSHLAYHLHEARWDEEFAALFDDDNWMKARFETSGYTYSGFLGDLTLAWNSTLQQHKFDSENSKRTTRFSQLVRYGLLQSSIISLSGNYPPNLVTKAVTEGYWTTDRALALIPNKSEPSERAKTYAYLLGTGILDPFQHAEVVSHALDSIASTPRDSLKTSSLKCLAPYLEGEQLLQCVDLAMTMVDKKCLVDAMVALAPRFNDIQRNSVLTPTLQLASGVEDDQERVELLSKMIPHLQGSLRMRIASETLTAALRIDNATDRIDALCMLIPCLEGGQRGDAVAVALTAMSQIEGELEYAKAVSLLAPNLSRHEKTRTLSKAYELALTIEGGWDRVIALASLLPVLEDERREKVLSEAIDNIEKNYAYMLIHNLTSRISGTGVSSALSRRLLHTVTKMNAHDVVIALADMLPCVGSDQREEIVALAVRKIPEIEIPVLRTVAINCLAQHLTGDSLREVLSISRVMRDDDTLSEALANLVPYLETDRCMTVLEVASRLDRLEDRVRVYLALARSLQGRQQEAAKGLALQIALELSERSRHTTRPNVQPLIDLIPNLEGIEREHALKECRLSIGLIMLDRELHVRILCNLALVLEGEKQKELQAEALSAAFRFARGWQESAVLAPIAPHLKDATMMEALEIALTLPESDNITGVNHRAKALLILAPHLDSRQREDVLSKTMSSIANTSNEEHRSAMLADLCSLLDEETLIESLDIARSIENDRFRVRALWAMAPHLKDEIEAINILEEFLAIMQEFSLPWAMSKAVPNLRGALLEKVIDVALKAKEPRTRAKALVALFPNLDEELLKYMLEVALESALEVEDRDELSQTLASLAEDRPVWVKAHAHVLRPVLIELLRSVPKRGTSHERSGYIEQLINLRSVWLPLLPSSAAWDVVRNLIDVCWEWEWQ